jgi:ribosomal-protein-alanine N-acetyltransferase
MSGIGEKTREISSLYVIEPMTVDDIPEVMSLERIAFPNPWPREAFAQEIERHPLSHPTVARTTRVGTQGIAGYCVARTVFGRVHIRNIAVHPAHLGRGLGRYLLEQALLVGQRAGALKAVLEVRESNEAARQLYLSAGFHEVGRRKDYYSNPREDAILFEKGLLDDGSWP